MAQKLLKFIITVLIIGAIYWLLMWLIGAVGVGDPFAKFARIGVIIVAVLALINALLALVGKAIFEW